MQSLKQFAAKPLQLLWRLESKAGSFKREGGGGGWKEIIGDVNLEVVGMEAIRCVIRLIPTHYGPFHNQVCIILIG